MPKALPQVVLSVITGEEKYQGRVSELEDDGWLDVESFVSVAGSGDMKPFLQVTGTCRTRK